MNIKVNRYKIVSVLGFLGLISSFISVIAANSVAQASSVLIHQPRVPKSLR